MNARELRERIGTLAWNTDFYQFARQILLVEPDSMDAWQNEMWRAFQSLATAMGRFDNAHLQRILDASPKGACGLKSAEFRLSIGAAFQSKVVTQKSKRSSIDSRKSSIPTPHNPRRVSS